MRCGMCGKPLKNPKSVRRGIGPVCYSKLQKGELKDKLDRVEALRLKARSQYSKNIRKYQPGPGEVRCKDSELYESALSVEEVLGVDSESKP